MTNRLNKTKTLVFSLALLLGGQSSAFARPDSPPLNPAQAQQLSRDLTRSSSQDFFLQGQERLEREIQILTKRRAAANKPLLKVYDVPPAQKDNLRIKTMP